MIDFIVNVVAEVVDFFINFYTDKIIDKFAKKREVKNSHLSGKSKTEK